MRETGDTRGFSLVGLTNLLLRRRRLVFATPAALVVLVALLTLVWPRSYTSHTALLHHSETPGLQGIAALAAQYGLSVPGTEGELSPEFYSELLSSSDVLGAAVTTPYFVDEEGDTEAQDLVAIWDVGGATKAIQREKASERLRRHTYVRVDRETGTVRFSVVTRSPTLSHGVATRLLELLHQFNVEKRQSQARAEREFAESRVAEARDSLRAAEEKLGTFIEENRRYGSSPQLTFEAERLQREVDLREQLLETLSQAYEQARLDEVRDTPQFTVVEGPSLPARPDRRGLLLRSMLAAVAGLAIGVFLALAAEMLASSRTSDSVEYGELHSNLRATAADLRSLVPGLRRGRTAGRGGLD